MKEVKFRGRRVGNSKWVYGFYALISNKHHQIFSGTWHHASGSPNSFEVNPETVGQYTGLKDAKDVEIYEGDIIQDAEENKYVILWDSGDARFVSVNLPDYILNSESRFDEEKLIWAICKVIGNIYENLELLKP